jgi:protein-disulfide isomerase
MQFSATPFSRFLLSIACLIPLAAQTAEVDWKTATQLPGVDLAGLSPAQSKTALESLRREGCTCGCAMKLAECRIKDPACSVSRGMAQVTIREARQGKSVEQLHAVIAEAARARMLGSPIAIPVIGAPVKGPADARITIVEFSDFQCPFCAQAVERANAVLAMYPKDVKLVFKQYPLESHPQAHLAAEAALAAHAQGKFWQMHDKLYAHYRELDEKRILAYAKEVGLDMDRFSSELSSGKYRAQVDQDAADGDAAGVQGTPTFYVNGKQFRAVFDAAEVKPILDAELKR